jgi:hypothetical protein
MWWARHFDMAGTSITIDSDLSTLSMLDDDVCPFRIH